MACTMARYSESEVPLERDDWWNRSLENMLSTQTEEDRMYTNQLSYIERILLKNPEASRVLPMPATMPPTWPGA